MKYIFISLGQIRVHETDSIIKAGKLFALPADAISTTIPLIGY